MHDESRGQAPRLSSLLFGICYSRINHWRSLIAHRIQLIWKGGTQP
jgi:hypothetical protein